ncbi:MBL fold metallo-hydrolase RNA specificity domain-containing protein [Lewinella sp. JB7]|uniref:MBL fold metallo-hydrolase RNA specificity domain-containing protein n=1 Tax=Lewinella sp. JB7 TaxID=2962887 RepID=UPI0020C96350|nr:MBL fold metallo-hydrolase [Lewinella sp. JB7]MCP9236806.1 MBL fold metallo-hydrolase [Lewinella sp. JB7]
MKIQFCGAAREVTGSAHLITLDDGYRILLDCGLYQGRNEDMENFNQHFPFDPAGVDALVLSHAHIDHTGRVPKLVKDGFRGNIYATHATRSLCAILLLDSAFIQEKDAEYYNKRNRDRREPLYVRADVKPTMDRFVGLPYGVWTDLRPGVEIQFRDAGHILGSASVTLRVKRQDGRTTTLGFTGDVGRPDRPILRDPHKLPDCDYLISESTYGDREHESPPNELDRFLQVIHNTCVRKKGKLLIPAFSVGRTQEIVYMLDQLESSGKLPRIPVFVDSPLAVNATTVFGAHPECYDSELQTYMLTDDNPFGFNDLTYTQSVEESKALNFLDGPAIIISASGMMNAGRSKHHLANTMGDPKNTIFIVGYCAPGTPGGKLRDGVEGMKLFGQYHELRADVVVMDSFSAHADRSELIHFLNGQQDTCQKVFLVHGTLDRMEALGEGLDRAGFREVDIPKLGDEVEL